MMDKKKINEVLQGVIADKIQKLTHSIKLIDDSAANETKSSAGDKYETSRAMLQQEKDKKLGQLDLWNSYDASLKLIEVSQHDSIQLGSVVVTDKNIIYVAVPVGKIQCDGKQIFAISTDAPLYKIMEGKTKDDEVSVNGKAITIKDVL
jgi:transcription elongation GreA/GreB family factor